MQGLVPLHPLYNPESRQVLVWLLISFWYWIWPPMALLYIAVSAVSILHRALSPKLPTLPPVEVRAGTPAA